MLVVYHNYHIAGESREIKCCTRDGYFNPVLSDADNSLCMSFSIPSNDKDYPGRRCMPYVRSAAAPHTDCTPGVLEKMNQATHWLDLSQVYGSTLKQHHQIRLFKDGLLKVDKNGALASMVEGNGCCLVGDSRINLHPTLGAIQTLFVREHNRWAKVIKDQANNLEDSAIFEMARRFNIAQYQHIIYNEFLPLLLGYQKMNESRLMAATKGFSRDYNARTDATVSNEFGAAASNVFWSMIRERMQRPSRKVSSEIWFSWLHQKTKGVWFTMVRIPIFCLNSFAEVCGSNLWNYRIEDLVQNC